MRTPTFPSLVSFSLLGLALLGGGCSIAGDYRIREGTTHTRSYTSVAGAVQVGPGATISNARTVAGEITVDAGAHTGDLNSVAGNIRLGRDVRVDGAIHTVAGNIRAGSGCIVSGSVSSVAGNIEVTDSEIRGGVTQTAGKLELTRTRVAGTVRIKHTRSDTDRPPRVDLGPGCDIHELVVDEHTEAEVRIHRSAKVGSIKGVTPEYYD
jgi:cytoskeletal protein CcmA (bactofilin family)